MDGLSFTAETPVASHPARMDVACFAGFVARRGDNARFGAEEDEDYLKRTVPGWLLAWWKDYGWWKGPAGRVAEDLANLSDVPVPIQSWEAFDELFSWDKRPIGSDDRTCDTWLGAAVRRFFAAGGRKCYVIRVGDPFPVLADRTVAGEQALLPVMPAPSAADRRTWRGIGHLYGLSDVSFLGLPDLPDLFAVPPQKLNGEMEAIPIERFIECASRAEPAKPRGLQGISAPRCDGGGFARWAAFVKKAAAFLHHCSRNMNMPEPQLIASIPLPVDESVAGGGSDGARRIHEAKKEQWTQAGAIHSRAVQLVYPWVRSRHSGVLPGGMEAPAEFVTGLLSQNALLNATWNSAIRQPVPGVAALEPVLDRATLDSSFPAPGGNGLARRLRDRVTVIGPAPAGFRLLSDVTTAGGIGDDLRTDDQYRPANINRLLQALIRTAKLTGEGLQFRNNGEALWRNLREGLETFLGGLWGEGALAGTSVQDAYQVRCDRSTMTQSDIDNGRVIARVSFTAAMPITHITVVFAVANGGQVSLVREENQPAVLATA